jgi:hypothetical protein
MGIDAIVSLVSLFGPKLLDLVKGVVHRKDSPEQVLATLATTNPEALAKYIEAQAKLMEAQNASVNSDISGQVWEWVTSVRALIRPLITMFGIVHIAIAHLNPDVPAIPDEAMYVYETAICSWFGSRMK